jgi:hypothetical protein
MMPPDKYSMLLKSIQMFFLTSWVHKINEYQQTKDGNFLAEEIMDDLKIVLEFANTVPFVPSFQRLCLLFTSSLATKTEKSPLSPTSAFSTLPPPSF